jgi:hypothetical protein
MKPNAADRLRPRRAGWLLVALGAAAVLVLGGCGQFNDDPNTYDMAVRYSFDPGTSSPAGTSGRMYDWDVAWGTPAVQSLVIGAVIVTFSETAITGPGDINQANETDLVNDVVASLSYLELVQLSAVGADGIVSFRVPPENAGNWQLLAAGLRSSVTAFEDINESDVIWLGFTPTFLNGQVQPGQLYSLPLVLNPYCNAVNPPSGGSIVCP